MALIDADNLNPVVKNNKIHKKVICEYSIFEDSVGNKYFQLDTFGSQDRVFTEKISQTIQLDKNSAKKVVDILKKEFSL